MFQKLELNHDGHVVVAGPPARFCANLKNSVTRLPIDIVLVSVILQTNNQSFVPVVNYVNLIFRASLFAHVLTTLLKLPYNFHSLNICSGQSGRSNYR